MNHERFTGQGHGPHPHHHHHGPRGGRARRDEFGFGPGFGGPRGGFGPRGGRRRMRRGDVRSAILLLLEKEPLNGYQLMQEIEERSEGSWRPSPGSIYPALSQLEDEGLVTATEADGRKLFTLTDEGKSYVEESRDKLGEPWAETGPPRKAVYGDFGKQVKSLMAAASQVAQAGSEDDVKQANEVLAEARRKIYTILAETDSAE